VRAAVARGYRQSQGHECAMFTTRPAVGARLVQVSLS